MEKDKMDAKNEEPSSNGNINWKVDPFTEDLTLQLSTNPSQQMLSKNNVV